MGFYEVLHTHLNSNIPLDSPQVPYIKDLSENRRLGTLLVFLDEGVTSDEPLMALPLNLAVTLDLPDDQAFVGFTASTGLKAPHFSSYFEYKLSYLI